VDPTKRPLPGVERNAALHQLGIQFVALKFFLAPSARKEPALVGLGLELNLETSGSLVSRKIIKQTTALEALALWPVWVSLRRVELPDARGQLGLSRQTSCLLFPVRN
jgi:hypothetical protein